MIKSCKFIHVRFSVDWKVLFGEIVYCSHITTLLYRYTFCDQDSVPIKQATAGMQLNKNVDFIKTFLLIVDKPKFMTH
jgi:hypothetical protein